MKNKAKWIDETLYPAYKQSFKIKKELLDIKSKFQHIQIYETERHGRVLFIDGVVQLTEADEYIYHEMLVHVPLLSHPNPKKVLIIGGGDGGALQRVLMYKSVTKVVVVDIDPMMIAISKKFLTKVSNKAFIDTRTQILNADGAEYVKNTNETFDVILTDRGDPIGPIHSLFEKAYYKNSLKCLNPDGILVSLTGVPFMEPSELKTCINILKSTFKINTCYLVPVPTYIGGALALTWSSQHINPKKINFESVKKKYKKLKTEYYNPDIHQAAFALPNTIQKLFGQR